MCALISNDIKSKEKYTDNFSFSIYYVYDGNNYKGILFMLCASVVYKIDIQLHLIFTSIFFIIFKPFLIRASQFVSHSFLGFRPFPLFLCAHFIQNE